MEAVPKSNSGQGSRQVVLGCSHCLGVARYPNRTERRRIEKLYGKTPKLTHAIIDHEVTCSFYRSVA